MSFLFSMYCLLVLHRKEKANVIDSDNPTAFTNIVSVSLSDLCAMRNSLNLLQEFDYSVNVE